MLRSSKYAISTSSVHQLPVCRLFDILQHFLIVHVFIILANELSYASLEFFLHQTMELSDAGSDQVLYCFYAVVLSTLFGDWWLAFGVIFFVRPRDNPG